MWIVAHAIFSNSSLMHAWGRGIQVDMLDCAALFLGLADEGREVAGGALALTLDLDSVVALLVKVLEALLEADAEI